MGYATNRGFNASTVRKWNTCVVHLISRTVTLELFAAHGGIVMRASLIQASAILFSWLACASGIHAQENVNRPRTISVSGTAEIRVAPDEAILTLGIQSQDKDLAIAKTQNDKRLKKILTVAREAGIETKYIQTSSLTMEPEYSQEKAPRLLDYKVSQTIVVTMKDLSRYEALMTSFLEAGLNHVDGIQFMVSDPKKFREEVRVKAVRAAREKAVTMAAELGQKVGKPWEVSEATDSDIPYRASNILLAYNGAPGPEGESALPSGEVTIRASVRVSFQLE